MQSLQLPKGNMSRGACGIAQGRTEPGSRRFQGSELWCAGCAHRDHRSVLWMDPTMILCDFCRLMHHTHCVGRWDPSTHAGAFTCSRCQPRPRGPSRPAAKKEEMIKPTCEGCRNCAQGMQPLGVNEHKQIVKLIEAEGTMMRAFVNRPGVDLGGRVVFQPDPCTAQLAIVRKKYRTCAAVEVKHPRSAGRHSNTSIAWAGGA